MARPLASDERAILGVLLTKEFEGRDEIEAQLANVTVEPIPGDPISLRLRIAEDAPRAGVRGRVPTDAFGYDADGNLVGILLHVLDGYANELEFFAADSDVRPGLPAPDTVKVAEWSEPDSSGLSVSLNSPPAIGPSGAARWRGPAFQSDARAVLASGDQDHGYSSC